MHRVLDTAPLLTPPNEDLQKRWHLLCQSADELQRLPFITEKMSNWLVSFFSLAEGIVHHIDLHKLDKALFDRLRQRVYKAQNNALVSVNVAGLLCKAFSTSLTLTDHQVTAFNENMFSTCILSWDPLPQNQVKELLQTASSIFTERLRTIPETSTEAHILRYSYTRAQRFLHPRTSIIPHEYSQFFAYAQKRLWSVLQNPIEINEIAGLITIGVQLQSKALLQGSTQDPLPLSLIHISEPTRPY